MPVAESRPPGGREGDEVVGEVDEGVDEVPLVEPKGRAAFPLIAFRPVDPGAVGPEAVPVRVVAACVVREKRRE